MTDVKKWSDFHIDWSSFRLFKNNKFNVLIYLFTYFIYLFFSVVSQLPLSQSDTELHVCHSIAQ